MQLLALLVLANRMLTYYPHKWYYYCKFHLHVTLLEIFKGYCIYWLCSIFSIGRHHYNIGVFDLLGSRNSSVRRPQIWAFLQNA